MFSHLSWKITIILLIFIVFTYKSTNVASAQETLTLDSVYRIAWSPIKNQVAFANFRNLYVWDFDSHKLVLQQELNDKSPLSGLRWSTDGARLAANSYAVKTLKVWDVNTGALSLNITEPTSTFGLDWTPDGKQILTGSSGVDNTWEIYCWDALNGDLLAHYDRGAEAIYRSPDHRTLATLSDVQINLRDAVTLETQTKLDKDINVDEGLLASIAAWSPDGQLLAGGYQNGMVRLWDTESTQLLNQFKANNQVYVNIKKEPVVNGVVPNNIAALTFSADSQSIWVLSYDGTLRQWNIGEGKFALEQEIATPLFAAEWNPDGTRLAVSVPPDTTVGATAQSQDDQRLLEEFGLKIIVPSSST